MLRTAILGLMGLSVLLLVGQTGTGQFREVGTELQRGNPQFLAAFRESVARPSKSTVRILCDGTETALGIIAGEGGWIITKANDLRGTITCKLRDGRVFEARVVGTHPVHDVALLKIPVRGLVPVEFKESRSAVVGNWVVCAGVSDDPLAIGIVSVATRTISTKGVNSDQGYLGVAVERVDGILRITQVVPDTPAAKAGLRSQDVLLALQGQTMSGTDSFVDLMQKQKVGEMIQLRIRRGGDEHRVQATLIRRPNNTRGDFQNRLGSELSSRTTGYTTILQHDAVIRPHDCGGPLLDLDGKVIGINICRAGRTESWAIPTETLHTVLNELMGRSAAAPR